jgi:flagellar basal-body rod protein FlgB
MSVTDGTMDVIYQAMRGLAERQRVTANNVANVQTPGFKASRVDFETNLRDAVEQGAVPSADVAPEITTSTAPDVTNGNNVKLDDETVSMIKTNLQYQTMVEAMNAKFRLLKTAMGG